jgi:hypothetical protein
LEITLLELEHYKDSNCTNTGTKQFIGNMLICNYESNDNLVYDIKKYEIMMLVYLWHWSKSSPMLDMKSNFRMCQKYRMIIIRVLSLQENIMSGQLKKTLAAEVQANAYQNFGIL